MQKLVPVEEATALMTVAMDWGVWRWLLEKGRVRAAADRANEALDEAEKQAMRQLNKAVKEAQDESGELKPALDKVKRDLKESHDARWRAEDTFDEAERRLNTGMAREGAGQAIDAWAMREKAIRKAEALARRAAKA